MLRRAAVGFAGRPLRRLLCSSSDPYAVLGIPRTATKDEIKAAFRRAALKYHPDRNPDNREEAEAQFRRASDAYAALSGKETGRASGGGYRSGSQYQRRSQDFGGGEAEWRRRQNEEAERIFREAFGGLEELLRQMEEAQRRGGARGSFGGPFPFGGFPGAFAGGFANGGANTQVRTQIVQRPDGRRVMRTETTTIDAKGNRSVHVQEQELPVGGPGFAGFSSSSAFPGQSRQRRPGDAMQGGGFLSRILGGMAQRVFTAAVNYLLRRLLTRR